MTSRLRLLQVIAGAEQGGAERFFSRLVIALNQYGVDQHVVMRPFDHMCQLMSEHQIAFSTANFGRLFDFQTPRVLKAVIREFQPDIIISWMSRASAHLPHHSPAIHVARLGGYYDLKYYKSAEYLIGNTQDLVNYFINSGRGADQCAYLPNFADPPAATSPLPRHEFNTPDGVPLLLTLGRLHDDKAFDVLIKALKHIPQAYLWIGGDGDKKKELQKLAWDQQVMDRIRFLGWRQDISRLMMSSDLYICPSRIEPLGNVILEAWTHQRAVVAAKSKGPEGLIEHGHNGLLVELEDSHGLAKAINRLIQDQSLCQDIAAQGYQSYQEQFTEDKVTRAYLQFFEKIINAKGK